MDEYRPFRTAEINFFSRADTGNGKPKITWFVVGISSLAVPVVAIFTKFDALEDQAYGELEDEGVSHEDAVAQASTRAMADFENKHLSYLYKQKYPPRGHVYLRDLNKPDVDCRELLQTVAAVIDKDILQRSFVKLKDISQDDIVVALMGPTGVGKSTFVGVATGSKTSDNLLQQSVAVIRAVRTFRLTDGRPVVFVDTPGFDDTSTSNVGVLKEIANCISRNVHKRHQDRRNHLFTSDL